MKQLAHSQSGPLRTFVSCVLAVLSLSPLSGFAQTWIGEGADSNWTTSGNWTGGTPANDSTASILLGLSGSDSASVVDTKDPWNIGKITFSEGAGSVSLSGNTLAYTPSADGDDPITSLGLTTATHTIANDIEILGTLSNATLNIIAGYNSPNVNLIINGNISTGSSNRSISVRGLGNDSILTGAITGANTGAGTIFRGFVKNDTGTWTLTNSDNKLTDVNVANGTLRIGADNGLGTVVTQIRGGGVFDLNGHNQTAQWLGQSASGTVTNSSVDRASVLTLTGTGTRETSGAITGNLALTKTGTGIQTFNGNSSYTGTTTLNGGDVYINGSHVVANGTTAGYAINDGATLGGDGEVDLSAINQGMVFASGAKLSPGAAASTVGTFTVSLGTASFDLSGAVEEANTETLVFDLDTVDASDQLILSTGILNIGENLLSLDDFSFSTLEGFSDGIYTLISTNESIEGSLATSGLLGQIAGLDVRLTLSDDGRDLQLRVGTAATAGNPEPGALGVLMGALAFSSVVCRRRFRSC